MAENDRLSEREMEILSLRIEIACQDEKIARLREALDEVIEDYDRYGGRLPLKTMEKARAACGSESYEEEDAPPFSETEFRELAELQRQIIEDDEGAGA